MPLLDTTNNTIVVRVVYDGPPEAGKTTTLRELARALGRPLHTPDERGGRTVFFDWLDYCGGRFAGHEVRCQIASVPGQDEFRARRLHLLRSADVIVYVADSDRAAIEATTAHLRALPAIVADLGPPPVAVLFQANKRDLPGALPIQALRARLESLRIRVGVVETIAELGVGVRETFVLAVRLALDRVREQLATNSLARGRPAIENQDELLEAMLAAERPARSSAPPAPEPDRRSRETDSGWTIPELLDDSDTQPMVRSDEVDADRPLAPTASVASGLIWPPVEGRITLHAAVAAGLLTHRQLASGDWAAGLGNGWRTHSHRDAVFADEADGRDRLSEWARLHASCGDLLSRRCIVLAAVGDETFRLWQVVAALPSLRDELADLRQLPTEEVAELVTHAVTTLIEMTTQMAAAAPFLPCTLETIGRSDERAVYVGLMPQEGNGQANTEDGQALVKAEIEPILEASAADRRAEWREAILRNADKKERARPVRESLSQLLGS